MRENEARYAEILRQIRQRRPFGAPKPKATPPQRIQERALDLVNAVDSLAELSARSYERITCYGPMTLRGSTWSAAVIWHHDKGYHGYRQLNLLGVWTIDDGAGLELRVGTRGLPYRAPVYDPGVYRVAIEHNFRVYYEDDGGPPGDSDRMLYRAIFSLPDRLRHRLALEDALRRWRDEMEAD